MCDARLRTLSTDTVFLHPRTIALKFVDNDSGNQQRHKLCPDHFFENVEKRGLLSVFRDVEPNTGIDEHFEHRSDSPGWIYNYCASGATVSRSMKPGWQFREPRTGSNGNNRCVVEAHTTNNSALT
jgi:hypothetical protein